ncbi:hypothetical protein ScPMuIL_015873 [Solemya velum]
MNSSEEAAAAATLTRLGLSRIRDHQREAVRGYWKGEDVFLCAKTGSGKSLVFEMAPFLFDFIESKHYRGIVTSMVPVVSPLVALVRRQTKILCSRGINAAYLGDSLMNVSESNDKFSMDDIRNGHVNIVFGSQESFVCEQRDLLKELDTKMKAIFVDEAQCVVKYGRRAKKNTPAFREAYGRISELRSVYGNRVPIVALTATASKDMVHKIKKDLGILQCLSVIGDPNKENIRYHVKVVNGGLESDFEWLVNLFEILETSFRDQGMGMDVKVVKHVVHYGPADDVDSYLQETGWAGRDPVSHCEAVSLEYKHSLNGRHISKSMKDYCEANVCRRVQLQLQLLL